MKILIRLDDREWAAMSQDEKQEELFSQVETVYEWSADDDEAYLCDSIGECVFGMDNPEELCQIARGWNANIIEDFDLALRELLKDRAEKGAYRLDTQITYELKKATMALDNSFYSFAEYATCLGENQNYLKTIITESELADVQQNPSAYALIEVYPK